MLISPLCKGESTDEMLITLVNYLFFNHRIRDLFSRSYLASNVRLQYMFLDEIFTYFLNAILTNAEVQIPLASDNCQHTLSLF